MQSIRRSTLVVVAAVLAVLTGSTPAFAGAAPLIEPAPGSSTVDATSSSDGFLDSWVQVGLAVLVAVALVVVLTSIVSRMRHHVPSAA